MTGASQLQPTTPLPRGAGGDHLSGIGSEGPAGPTEWAGQTQDQRVERGATLNPRHGAREGNRPLRIRLPNEGGWNGSSVAGRAALLLPAVLLLLHYCTGKESSALTPTNTKLTTPKAGQKGRNCVVPGLVFDRCSTAMTVRPVAVPRHTARHLSQEPLS